MTIDNNKIVAALRTVTDPETGQDIITAKRIRDLKIDGDQVNFTIQLPSPNPTYKSQLNFACMEAIGQVYPQANVNIHVLAGTPQTAKAGVLSHVKNIIAVASGKGGVGKSTVSVNLALGLQKLGAKVGIMDADLYGPSLPTMLGLQGQRPKIQDLYGKARIMPLEAYGMPVMSIGFIVEPEQAVVLRGPRLGGIIKQFVQEVVWPPLDFLIIDLPPGTGDIQLSLVQTVPITGAIMVTTPQDVAVIDAVKAMNMFLLDSVNVPILGVVENMAWFTPKELPNNKYYIFGNGGGKKLAKMSESMLLGQVPLMQGVREGGDSGTPVIMSEDTAMGEIFLKIAQNVARQTALRNEFIPPAQTVKME